MGTETWQDTGVVLPPGVTGTWTDAITDRVIKAEERLPIGDALTFFPISLLIGRENPS